MSSVQLHTRKQKWQLKIRISNKAFLLPWVHFRNIPSLKLIGRIREFHGISTSQVRIFSINSMISVHLSPSNSHSRYSKWNNPGGDCCWVGGSSKAWYTSFQTNISCGSTQIHWKLDCRYTSNSKTLSKSRWFHPFWHSFCLHLFETSTRQMHLGPNESSPFCDFRY